MRKGALALTAFAVLLATATYADGIFNLFGRSIKGSGEMKTVERDLPPFTEIKSSGSFDINIKIGPEQKVALTFDDNLVDNIETEVRNDVLIIDSKESYSSRKTCTIDITVPSIEGVRLSGSGNIDIENLDADHFEYVVSGSGSLRADGKARDFDVRISGSGDVDASDLAAENATVKVSGSGNARVRVSNSFDGSISGSGNIYYYGDPAHASTSISGSGSIRKRD